MKYICDAPGDRTWFQLETEGEAIAESALMEHAVEKHYLREQVRATTSYKPTSEIFIERDIGLKDHIIRTMPMFLTLRDMDGKGLATAMLPTGGRDDPNFRIIVVGPKNTDPYSTQADAITALGTHFKLDLPRSRCFPYAR